MLPQGSWSMVPPAPGPAQRKSYWWSSRLFTSVWVMILLVVLACYVPATSGWQALLFAAASGPGFMWVLYEMAHIYD